MERDYEARLLAQMDASSANKCTAPLNSAVLAFVGPGGAGKTSAILAIQDLALSEQRQSTCGGEGSRLVVGINRQQLQGFVKASTDLSRVQRALQMLLDQSAQIDDNCVDLDCFVTGSDTHDRIPDLRRALEVMGLLMARVSNTATTNSSKATVKAKPPPVAPRPSRTSVSKLQRAGQGSDLTISARPSASALLPKGSSHVVPEQIEIRKEAAVIARSQRGHTEDDHSEGVHTLLFDLGGQPEFWPLVGEFLRRYVISMTRAITRQRVTRSFTASKTSLLQNPPPFPAQFLCSKSIISVFCRLDELEANVLRKTSVASDSTMKGLDELLIWLDAVVSRTTEGPVLLAFSHADKVQSEDTRRIISEAVISILSQRDHPVVHRLVQPESGLAYFALDNRCGLRDEGVRSYRDTLQKLCEAAPSATQRVPLDLLRFFDALAALEREPAGDDLRAVQQLRRAHGRLGRVSHITLSDAAFLFSAVTARNVTADLNDKEFRLYIDFLHMMGAITHSNAPGLEDLIIIDPLWLLRQQTIIVRRPSLHPRPGDDLLPATLFDSLYCKGILEPEMIPKLWSEHSPKLRLQLLGLMVQVKLKG